MPARNRQLLLLIVALLVMVGFGVLLFLNSVPSAGGPGTPGVTASANSAGPNETGPSGPAPTGPGGGSLPAQDRTGSGPVESVQPSVPPPSPGSGATAAGQGPVSAPTGGPLGPAEKKRVTTVINSVVPSWSEADFANRPGSTGNDRDPRDLTRKWVAGWRNEDHVTADFTETSTTRFTDIWGGAIQMAATVSDAKITSATMIDNYGVESYWKVDVERTVTAPGVQQTEQVTWYFMIENGADGPLLDQFYLPSDLVADEHEHQGGHDG